MDDFTKKIHQMAFQLDGLTAMVFVIGKKAGIEPAELTDVFVEGIRGSMKKTMQLNEEQINNMSEGDKIMSQLWDIDPKETLNEVQNIGNEYIRHIQNMAKKHFDE